MDLLNVLTKEDYKKITAYIDTYIDGRKATVEKILTPWAQAKEDLYTLLGNNLVIHKSVVVEKEINEIESELIKKLEVSRDERGNETFYGRYKTFFNKHFPYDCKYDFRELGEVFDEQLDLQIVHNLLDNIENLSSNRYKGKQITIHFPSGHNYTFTYGTKLFKILKKISDEFEIEGYEEYRQLHSQILNEKSLKGELYLSIHPLDYITMSDNDCGWSSCMSWSEDGDYCRGTIEMMDSPMVVEAYIPSSVDMFITGDLTWNNKRWRQLFIVDKRYGVVAIKGYPYWNRGLEKIVLDWLKDLMQENWGIKCKEELYKFNFQKNNVPETVNTGIPDDTTYYFNTYAMYNDLYGTHYAYLTSTDKDADSVEITYSGHAVCMCCGEVSQEYDHEGKLICDDCEPVYYCSDCGEKIYNDEFNMVDGEYYCNYCYENLPTCFDCGEVHNQDNMYQIYLVDDEGFLNQFIWLCEDCLNSQEFFPVYDMSTYHINDRWGLGETLWTVKIADLTPKGRELFDVDNLNKQRHLTYTDGIYEYYNNKKTVSIKKNNAIWDPDYLYFKAIGMITDKIVSWTIENETSSIMIITDNTTPEDMIYQMLKGIFPEVEDKEILDYINNYKTQYQINIQDEDYSEKLKDSYEVYSNTKWLSKVFCF